jgi:hypothetical protein
LNQTNRINQRSQMNQTNQTNHKRRGRPVWASCRRTNLKKNIRMILRSCPMSSKDLQRVTKCVSDIGQAASRRSLPPRRHHVTQKVRIAGQRTLYINVHDDAQPAKIFLRLKGPDCSSGLIGLYDVVASLMSIALQDGLCLRRWAISSLEPSVFQYGLCPGTTASSIVRVCRI